VDRLPASLDAMVELRSLLSEIDRRLAAIERRLDASRSKAEPS
jgi:hypothetical protein